MIFVVVVVVIRSGSLSLSLISLSHRLFPEPTKLHVLLWKKYVLKATLYSALWKRTDFKHLCVFGWCTGWLAPLLSITHYHWCASHCASYMQAVATQAFTVSSRLAAQPEGLKAKLMNPCNACNLDREMILWFSLGGFAAVQVRKKKTWINLVNSCRYFCIHISDFYH